MKLSIDISENGIQSENKIIAKEFLTRIVKEMCLASWRYFSAYKHISNRHPLTFGERSMYALLSTAASRISPVILSERRAEKRPKKTSGFAKEPVTGRFDLWAYSAERKCDFLIELKRTQIGLFAGMKDDAPAKTLIREWKKVVSQSLSLTRASESTDYGKKAVRIGLLVIFCYSRKQNLSNDKKRAAPHIAKIKQIVSALKPTSDFSAYWKLPVRMRFPDAPRAKGKRQFNPVIAFVGHVEGHNG